MKKIFYILLSLVSFLISSVSYANCPPVESIFQNKQHPDSWQAPWYEGFTQGAKPGAKVKSFDKACWYRYWDDKPNVGVSYCYYKLEDGSELSFVQNNWDISIPKPTGSEWSQATTETCDLVCHGSPDSCNFAGYPPRR